jgi:hypothetical protein
MRVDKQRRPYLTGLTTLALAALVVACSVVTAPPPPGSREWRMTVENQSHAPARLFVAEDLQQMGAMVGTAVPNTVPAGATQEVVFTVPPGDGWAIFVNPGPMLGPLILAGDVPPDVAGDLPISIGIGPDGSPYSSTERGLGPGWFGE